MQYLGDFSEDDTVYIPFNTFSSDDPQASVTITNLADADIKVHKDGSTTEIATDGATVSIDFDGITGNHLVTIDTSASADYSTGSDYLVRMEGTTVDAGTINAFIASFSIENRHSAGALRPTTAGRTLDVTSTGAAGIDWGNVENQATAVDLSGTDIQLCDTVTTLTGHTAQTGDSFARIGANGAGLTAVPWNSSWDAEVQSECSDALTAYNAVATSDLPTNFVDMSISATTGLVDITQAAADKAWSTTTRILTASTNFNDISPSEVNAEVVDVLETDTHAESASVPAATSSLKDKITYMFTLNRNKMTQTATTTTLRNDADSANISTSTVSDDGTTFTKGEHT